VKLSFSDREVSLTAFSLMLLEIFTA